MQTKTGKSKIGGNFIDKAVGAIIKTRGRYRFSPRLADIGGQRFWRIDANADYGELNVIAR